MKKLLLASFNRHKLEEFTAILGDLVSILTPEMVGYTREPEESADTLEGNALIKARSLYNFVQQPCFADDTGLEVACLGGEPGVKSARYAGDQHNDADNRRLLLDKLASFPLAQREARFRTVIAFIDDEGKEHLFEGSVKGQIIAEERGVAGFGYDSLFVPDGFSRTFAEMSEEEKNQISHRGKATGKFFRYLQETLT